MEGCPQLTAGLHLATPVAEPSQLSQRGKRPCILSEVKYVWPMESIYHHLSIYLIPDYVPMETLLLSQVCSLTSTTCLLRGRSPPGAERPDFAGMELTLWGKGQPWGDSYITLRYVELIWNTQQNRVLLEKIDLSMVDSP